MGRKRNHIRPDKWVFLLLILLLLSIGLSLLIKSQSERKRALSSELESVNASHALKSHRLEMMNEVFRLSVETAGLSLDRQLIESLHADHGVGERKAILHLKEDACVDCYRHAMIECMDRMKDAPNFMVISHSSNYYFIEEMIFMDILHAGKQIIFYDGELHRLHNTDVTAELILADGDLRIQAILPANSLADRCLAAIYYDWIMQYLSRPCMVS